MKPQKKAVGAQKAQKTPATIAKKRRASPEKYLLADIKKLDKKSNNKSLDKIEESKKKIESDKKKLEKAEKRKKMEDNRKKNEEKKKEKFDKVEDNKKKSCKENEKRSEIIDDNRIDKNFEKIEVTVNDTAIENNKKKYVKLDDKMKTEKQILDNKRKNERVEDKKKIGKIDEILEDGQKCNNIGFDENFVTEDKLEVFSSFKKKGKEDKRKDAKATKTECKENSKSPTTKEKKVAEAKKSPDKEAVKKVVGTTNAATTTMKKESKAKQQPQKKTSTTAMKKTVLANKSHSALTKKFIEKKLKLVKIARVEEDNNVPHEEENNTVVSAAAAAVAVTAVAKSKKKNSIIPKGKALTHEKKPKLAKQMKVKLSQKNVKLNNVLKKDKMKKITEKIATNKKKIEIKENADKPVCDGNKKTANTEEPLDDLETNEIKSEICEDKEEDKNRDESSAQVKSVDCKKTAKNAVKQKIVKKLVKKVTKSQSEESDEVSTKSEDVSLEDLIRQSKNVEENAKIVANSKKETAESVIKIDLKVEAVNGEESYGEASPTSASDSEDDYEDEIESRGRGKQKNMDRRGGKERESSPLDERARRMRLFGFWSGPKRHRVASLNALAKVHCLYENEAGGVYLGGFCKPKPDNQKPRKAAKEESKEEAPAKKPKETKKVVVDTAKVEDNNKRNLRNVPGLRGKHWDMMESSSSSSSSSSSDEDSEREKTAMKGRKKNTTRRKKNEQVMDLKDMVVCKRMASLNASAILAASYSDEKNRLGSSASESSSESEVEVIKKRKQGDSELENKRKSAGRRISGDPTEEVIKPSKKVMIVNQDTDVTITGVYVNQTRSTHHEGFCSIAGMQYRISSTSHTQTAATAVAAELHEQQKTEQPCKSYTPLGALSSMQPPGSQGNHVNVSPRRHSAFSAPHQHGYYQPAGPLIQHPPTLPPVKGPPPEPTPTPPQNSEGSDDLVATSTTSGGTNSTGNSWRSFRKSESVTNAASSVRPSTSIVPSGGGFYRAYCPQYYGTPPQYTELCYPPTYSHPHSHPPPYYKYAPTYRRQYYGYPGADGGGGTGGAGTGAGPGVVEYQAPPPPGEYPMPPYYGGYPPPPPPPPPPPNPAYLHAQGRPIVDHAAFQGCPCPMQSCPKNVDTGPLIGNGKGAPVASGPGLSLPPSALVGPPSPARGLAGLAPPHGANAWDTDRVQLNTHRSNLNLQGQQQQIPPASTVHSIVGGAHSRAQNSECRTKDEKTCTGDKLGKCNCQKHACTSTCEVKLEALSPTETLSSTESCPSEKTIHDFKLENNNVKCESCSVGLVVGQENISCAANCNVKCESDYKCEIMKCEQCVKEGQMAILELDKDSGILLIDEKRLEVDPGVKEELNDVVVVDTQNWQKPDYEPIVQEAVDEKDVIVPENSTVCPADESPKCQKLTKRKLSLDSLSDSIKKRKVDKRTLSVGSTRDFTEEERLSPDIVVPVENASTDQVVVEGASKKPAKKESQCQKRKAEGDAPMCDGNAAKKAKTSKVLTSNGITNNCVKTVATDSSIMETIDDVIQQSLQMSRKKERKCETVERTTENKKKKAGNLLSTIKKVTKKIDLVKSVVSEKLCLTKTEVKSVKEPTNNKCKVESKLKTSKSQDAKSKSNKVKSKIAEFKSKLLDSKSKVPETKTKEVPKKMPENNNGGGSGSCAIVTSKSRIVEVPENLKRAALVKKKRKSTKKTTCAKKTIANASCKSEDSEILIENCSLSKRPFLKPKWSNGWSWEGDSYEAKVYLTNEESAIRRCYASMKHVSGDVLRPRDCVLLKSGQRKADLPFVAKIAALWENPDDGEMMFSLLWYYRPEHTEQGRTDYDTEDEVFASRHRDANSVACIEDKCYILTFNEYCRYRKNLRRIEEGLESPGLIVPPGEQNYPRECRQPPIPVPSDMVLFCRRVYDYRGKKLVKNPG